MLPLSWEREVSAMEAVSVCFRGILLIKNRISTGFPLPIRSTGFSLSLWNLFLCFDQTQLLFSISSFSFGIGKNQNKKKDSASLLFFPAFINSNSKNPLWVFKTRLQIMNNILLYFDFLLRTSFSSPYWPLHHHTTIGPPPNSQTRPPPVSSMVIGARDKVWHPYNN